MQRPEWDSYFLKITQDISERSTCLRRKVGACVVLNKRILATGYNGAPSGLAHCNEIGCIREKQGVPSGERHELCRGLHAEMNGILQSAKHGISIDGATVYTNTKPCILCAKMMINCGIERVVYDSDYADTTGVDLLKEAGISVEKKRSNKEDS